MVQKILTVLKELGEAYAIYEKKLRVSHSVLMKVIKLTEKKLFRSSI